MSEEDKQKLREYGKHYRKNMSGEDKQKKNTGKKIKQRAHENKSKR